MDWQRNTPSLEARPEATQPALYAGAIIDTWFGPVLATGIAAEVDPHTGECGEAQATGLEHVPLSGRQYDHAYDRGFEIVERRPLVVRIGAETISRA